MIDKETIKVDVVKVAHAASRKSFGIVKSGKVYRSAKDYDRKSKREQRERNKLRRGEVE